MSGKDTGQNDLPDDRETGMSIEPLIPEEGCRYRPMLDRLADDLIEKSSALARSLPGPLHGPLASLMRVIECHYSNRIEGDEFSPLPIERASFDGSNVPALRFPVNHIRTQEWLDHGGLTADPLSPEGLCVIHEKLCEGLHEAQLIQTSRGGGHEPIVPGRFRQGYVQVGRHIAPSPGSVPRLLRHLNHMQRLQSPLGRIVWAASSHHRLVWIHPFPDHNGRTSRLVARALLSERLGAPPLWSLSRGLWRAIEVYQKSLSDADTPRQGGADGRGALSEERLALFAEFFLRSCIGEVEEMVALIEPRALEARMLAWARDQILTGSLTKGSDELLSRALRASRDEMTDLETSRSDMAPGEDAVLSALRSAGAMSIDAPSGRPTIRFSAALAAKWLPGLISGNN